MVLHLSEARPTGVLLSVLIGAMMINGCRRVIPDHVADQDPAVKIPAMVAITHDKEPASLSTLREVVYALASDDAAVRLFAIEALHRLTGQTFDYEFWADAAARRPAEQRWRQWLANRGDADAPLAQGPARRNG